MEKKRTFSREAGRETGERRQSLCTVSKKCGGCQYVDVPYEEQLKKKQRQTEQLLKEFGKVRPIIGMEHPAHYRNKVHAVFDFQKGKGIVSGIYQEKSHRVVPVQSCLLEDQKAGEIILSVRELAKSFKIKAYNEDSGYGLLRHVLVRVGHVTGEIMVVLVLGSPILPSKKNFVNELCKLHPEITTICKLRILCRLCIERFRLHRINLIEGFRRYLKPSAAELILNIALPVNHLLLLTKHHACSLVIYIDQNGCYFRV